MKFQGMDSMCEKQGTLFSKMQRISQRVGIKNLRVEFSRGNEE